MDTTCDHPTCASILSRLANTVRARLAYDEQPGFRDPILAVKLGLLDIDEGAVFASRCDVSPGAFLALVESERGYDELTRTKFIWKELRVLVFERDNGCVRCGDGYQQVHHIEPISKGGAPILPCNLQALCQNCHTGRHRAPPRKEGVSTPRGVGVEVGAYLYKEMPTGLSPQTSPRQGHPPNRHVLFDRWMEIRSMLSGFLHVDPDACQGADKWKRVGMVMEALRLQATRGQCFASAAHLALEAGGSRKTWDRTLARLRSLFLVSTERLVREDGTQSTNLADFSSLWALVLTVLQDRMATFEHLVNGIWLKLKGQWKHFEDFLEEVLSSSLPPPEARLRSPLHEGWVDYGQPQQRTY